MLRLILVFFIAFTALLNLERFNISATSAADSSRIIGNAKLYTFSSDDEFFLSNAQPFILPPSTPLKDALDSLGQHLAKHYFSKTYSNKATDIHFDVLGINEIPTPSGPLNIGVINMIDANEDGMKYFFQGSTGGQTTFCMLAATFIQPHLARPLLDGLVLLYNGEILPELDHINLEGILIPRLVKYVAKRAIHSTRRKAVIFNQDQVKSHKLKL